MRCVPGVAVSAASLCGCMTSSILLDSRQQELADFTFTMSWREFLAQRSGVIWKDTHNFSILTRLSNVEIQLVLETIIWTMI